MNQQRGRRLTTKTAAAAASLLLVLIGPLPGVSALSAAGGGGGGGGPTSSSSSSSPKPERPSLYHYFVHEGEARDNPGMPEWTVIPNEKTPKRNKPMPLSPNVWVEPNEDEGAGIGAGAGAGPGGRRMMKQRMPPQQQQQQQQQQPPPAVPPPPPPSTTTTVNDPTVVNGVDAQKQQQQQPKQPPSPPPIQNGAPVASGGPGGSAATTTVNRKMPPPPLNADRGPGINSPSVSVPMDSPSVSVPMSQVIPPPRTRMAGAVPPPAMQQQQQQQTASGTVKSPPPPAFIPKEKIAVKPSPSSMPKMPPLSTNPTTTTTPTKPQSENNQHYAESHKDIDNLFRQNAEFVENRLTKDPNFFHDLGSGHAPKYLWIGCSDARVPANEIMGEDAGKVFVVRNVANMVCSTDFNLMSALQYAVSVLKIPHIIVCGHYDCGGVRASIKNLDHAPPLENWLRNIRDVYRLHRDELDEIQDPEARHRRLVELNVIEQCINLFKTGAVQRNRVETYSDDSIPYSTPRIHACVFDPKDGILRPLKVDFMNYIDELHDIYDLYTVSDNGKSSSRSVEDDDIVMKEDDVVFVPENKRAEIRKEDDDEQEKEQTKNKRAAFRKNFGSMYREVIF